MNLRARKRELADRLVKQCLGIKPSDTVTISTTKHTIDLAEEISLKCFEVGADALLNLYTDRYYRGYLSLLTEESLREPSKFCIALTEASTAWVVLGWLEDPKQLRKVPREKFAAYDEGERKAHWPLQKERKVRVADLGPMHVTPQKARAYGFEYEKWLRASYRAATVDYDELNRIGRKIASALEDAERVDVVAPGGTDISFSLVGRKPRINDGVIDAEDVAEENLETSIPAGEVTIAPLEESAQGGFASDSPILRPLGSKVRSLKWNFDRGRVTEFEVSKEGRTLRERYAKAEGDKDRVGFFMIGINPNAVFGYTFDSLVQGAVTLGIGGNEEIGGKNRSSFSAYATLRRASVTVDGKMIVDRGKVVTA